MKTSNNKFIMFKYNFNHQDKKIINDFNKKGYLIFKLSNIKKLNKIKKEIEKIIFKKLKKKKIKIQKKDKNNILNTFHNYIALAELNGFRMSVYNYLNSKNWFLKNYFELAREKIEIICGNELAMQRKINLSIQFPNDDSSLLPIHSDVWSGCSPYEIVLWIPLVSVSKTKSMFILNKNKNKVFYKNFYKFKDSESLQNSIDKKIDWLNIKYGQGLIFSHQLVHGNKINLTNETRWSFNCRFKSLMSPYDKKDIAETFLPISIRPATIYGMNYEEPKTNK